MNPKATCPESEQDLGTGAQLRPRMKRDGVFKLKERTVPTITVRSQTRIPKRQTKTGNHVLPNVVLGLDGLLAIPRTHLQQTS